MSVTTTTVETNNVVDYYTNKEGDLYLKYFLIDSSFNKRGWAVDPSIIEKLAKRSIGAPFTDYEDFPVTRYSDQHPWHPNSSIFKDQYDYAAQKATGFAVDVSPTSSAAFKSASGNEIKDGYFVTIKIVDPIKKELYLKNPERIPKISAGIWDYDELDLVHGKTVVKNADIAHYAGVQKGAYGDKARMYASCQGGYECVNHLKGASELSSLGEKSTQNTDIMSDQSNPLSTVTQQGQENNELPAQSQEQKNEQPAQQLLDSQVNNNNTNKEETPNKQDNNKQSNDNTNKAPFRLKTQKFDFQPKNNKEEVKVPNWKEDEEYVKLQKEVEELKRERELEKTKAKYAEIIPRELFILNGKFDTIGYNKELQKAVEKNVDPDYANELYKLKLEKLRLSNSKGKPYGASASSANKEYKTPDTVPDSNNNGNLKGASDINSSQFSGIHNLFKMVGLVKEVSA